MRAPLRFPANHQRQRPTSLITRFEYSRFNFLPQMQEQVFNGAVLGRGTAMTSARCRCLPSSAFRQPGPAALRVVILMTLIAVFTVPLPAQTLSVLHSFGGTLSSGDSPYAGVVLLGNNLYGTTTYGGGNQRVGNVFELSHHGSGWVESV